MKRRLLPALLPLLMAGGLPATALALPGLNDVGEPQADFDGGRYLLGYEIYLARGNLAAAYRVAEKAVRLQPQDAAWRRRLAEVAQWQEQPEVALANWLELARMTGDETAWQAVGRMAPMLADDEAWLAWQQHEAQRHPGDTAQMNSLLSAFERVGRPQEGLAFLAELRRRHPHKAVVEAESLLAERTGADAQALADLAWLNARHGPEEGWLLRAAALHYQRGDLKAARAVLVAAEPAMPDSATAYWRTDAELARLLGDAASARRAYARVYASGQANEADLLNYGALLQGSEPLLAAQVQSEAFLRFGRGHAANTALYLWQSENRFEPAEAFLARLTPAQLSRLESDPLFLELRGRLREAQGRWREAMADYAAGLALAPGRPGLQQAWLSQLIEHGQPEALRKLLLEQAAAAARRPVLWSLWAAGWSRLDDAVQALPWLERRYRADPTHALNALAYADGLARAGLPEAARQVENRVWQSRQSALALLPAEQKLALQQALLNLELQRLPVDAGRQRLQALLRDTRTADGHVSPWVRDLVLGAVWAGEAGDSLPRDVSSRLPVRPAAPPPVWSLLLMALADNDRPALDELLDRHLDELPVYDRVEAAERLDRYDLAASLAFASAELRQGDDEIHRRLQERAWNDGSRLDMSFQHDKQGSLTRTPWALDWKGKVDGNVAVGLYTETAGLASNPAFLVLPVDTQQRMELGLGHKGERHDGGLWLTHLHSLESVNGLRGTLAFRPSAGLSAEVRAGWRQHSTATAGLRVGGERDFAGGALAWSITGRDSLALDIEFSRLRVQGGGALGTSLVSGLGYSHRLFSGERDWVLKAGVSNTASTTAAVLPAALLPLLPAGVNAGADYFVPQGYTQFSLGLAFGDNAGQSYQRGWRSFWELGLTQDADTGLGYDYRWGMLGRVLGRDRLRIYVDGADGAQGNGEKTQTFNVDYRLFY